MVAGAAVLGSGPPAAEDRAAVSIRPTARPSTVAAPTRDIVIDHPYREGAVVRPADLVVIGHLRQGSGPVRVIVETSRNKMLAVEQVEMDRAVTGRPARFAVTLPIGHRRAGERLIIHVIAYDARGLPIDVLRRRVVVGPDEPWIVGEDGLMGGIAVPSAAPPVQP